MCLKSEILASYRIGNVGMEMFVYSQMVFSFFFFCLTKQTLTKTCREKSVVLLLNICFLSNSSSFMGQVQASCCVEYGNIFF